MDPGRPISIKVISFGVEAALSLQLPEVVSVRTKPRAARW